MGPQLLACMRRLEVACQAPCVGPTPVSRAERTLQDRRGDLLPCGRGNRGGGCLTGCLCTGRSCKRTPAGRPPSDQAAEVCEVSCPNRRGMLGEPLLQGLSTCCAPAATLARPVSPQQSPRPSSRGSLARSKTRALAGCVVDIAAGSPGHGPTSAPLPVPPCGGVGGGGTGGGGGDAIGDPLRRSAGPVHASSSEALNASSSPSSKR